MADLPEDRNRRAPWVISADSSEELRRRYDQWAETYDDDLQQVDAYRAPQMVAAKLAEYAVPEGAVLDIACGTGLCGLAFREAGFRRLTGVDYAPAMLEKARGRGVYRDLKVADLNHTLPFEENSFHAATVVGLSLHFPPQAYHDIGRVLSPGGLILFCGDARAFKERGMQAVCDQYVEAGLWIEVERSEPFQPLPVSEPSLSYRIFIHQILGK